LVWAGCPELIHPNLKPLNRFFVEVRDLLLEFVDKVNLADKLFDSFDLDNEVLHG
jgi:hypothetical protein